MDGIEFVVWFDRAEGEKSRGKTQSSSSQALRRSKCRVSQYNRVLFNSTRTDVKTFVGCQPAIWQIGSNLIFSDLQRCPLAT